MTRSLKVLILEDVEADAELMVHELVQEGFLPDWIRVDTENSYLSALGSDPDLILSDFILPQFDAFLALQLMQEQKLDIPFIVISGAITEDVAVEFMKRGASDYLLKDRMARLGQAVVRALEQKELREEKRRTEEALRENERRFRIVSELITDFAYSCVMLSDGTLKIEWMTGAIEKITGYTIDEIRDMISWRPIVLDDDIPVFERYVEGLSPGESARSEIRIRKKDGGIVWLASFAQCLIDQHGPKIHRIYGGCRDITERKQAEEILRRNEEHLHLATQSANLGTYTYDYISGQRYLSPKLKALYGLKADEPLILDEDQVAVAVHPDDRSAFLSAMMAANDPYGKSDGVLEVDYRIILADGSIRWLRIHGHTEYIEEINNRRPWRASGVVIDITEYKNAERAMLKTSEDLERSNADLVQFAYVASHDLQEPLRTITRFVQLLENRYKGRLDQDADEFIDFIVGGTKRMQQLINDLLTYSRVNTRSEPLASMKLEDALQRALQNLSYVLVESEGTVTYDEMPTIVADELQMTQLFQNLIGNALKFHGEESPKVNISAIRNENDWIISVRDNGIGIDLKYKDRIFELFQRLHTREEYPGTGIGLTIAKKIVQRHGGQIWVDSEPGRGTTFSFSIPAMIDGDPRLGD